MTKKSILASWVPLGCAYRDPSLVGGHGVAWPSLKWSRLKAVTLGLNSGLSIRVSVLYSAYIN